ncbi:DUF917 domain-containing protein [Stappia sp.]|uniref:DUF917 domain-containing protein n=1 Tax=Stappia sp. TaxID=1870903 RepID=UPI003A9A2EDC
MLKTITSEEIDCLALGAWILGTGGGGNPEPGRLIMQNLYKEGTRVQLIDPDTIRDDASIATVASQGAPLVSQERFKDPKVIARSVELLARHLEIQFSCLMALEVGGSNAFYPLMAAAELGLPVVDADWMGRAYPELQMAGMCLSDIPPFPLVSVDPRGFETVITNATDWKRLEDISRKICSAYGSTASICLPPATGKQMKNNAVPRTLSFAIEIGATVKLANSRKESPIEALLALTGGTLLFQGKVTDVERRPSEGFLRGSLTITGSSDFTHQNLQIEFQNEWLLARSDEAPVAMSPDLICLLDEVTGEAIGTEAARYGQRVCVVVMPPPDIFCTTAGLALVGPRAFGFPLDYSSAFST